MVCECEIKKENLRGTVPQAVVSNPGRLICEPLSGMGIPAPFCPFNSEKQQDCPLAKAEVGKMSLETAVRRFYDMAPCLKTPEAEH